MPPLNHRMSDVEQSGSVYAVDVSEQNAGPDCDSTYEKGTHFVESFEGAVRVALNEFDGQPRVREMGAGMVFFYEPHNEGEKHLRAAIREHRVFATR